MKNINKHILKGDIIMEETIKLLEEEINSNLKELKNLDKGSEDYCAITNDTGKLLDKLTPMIKLRQESEIAKENREHDKKIKEEIRKEEREERKVIREEDRQEREEIRKEELEEKRKNREEDRQDKLDMHTEDLEQKKKTDLRTLILEGAKVGVPLLMFVVGMVSDRALGDKLLKFEEEGTLTSTEGRNFFSSVGRRKEK